MEDYNAIEPLQEMNDLKLLTKSVHFRSVLITYKTTK
jgi:hypothetical protein